ncbi:hypothetical protein FHS61_002293 [Altererythrobacter atlanticus]|nr:hypothetical protein [Croceibacterium atlanticum]MBB5733267.1 hypothetical protein [Croceibacterium atlanticum]
MFFTPRQQQLVELNESAAALVEQAQSGITLHDMAMAFVPHAQTRHDAQHMAASWLADACESGLFNAAIAPAPAHCAGFSVDLGGHDFEVVADDAALIDELRPPYGELIAPRGSGQRIHVIPFGDRIALLAEGGEAQFVAPGRLATRLRHTMLTNILSRESRIALHTACLVRGDRAVLLCGSPGTGKSTLTLALIAQGWGFAGDDIAFADPSGMVQGLPLPLTLKRGSWPHAAAWADVEQLPVHEREDGAVLKYLPVRPVDARPRRVGAVIRLQRQDGAQAAVDGWDRVAALQTLFGEAYSESGQSSAGMVRGMCDLVAGAQCLTLSYGEAADAAHLLAEDHALAF